MKVLGVDPGLVRTGWAAVESVDGGYRIVASGLVSPPPRADLAERLWQGFASFASILDEISPEVMILEDVFSAPRYPRAALLMAHMRGVLCLAAGQRGLKLESMTATTVKQRVTGNGHASKEQVAEMVFRLCGASLIHVRSDVSDAVALAVAGLNQLERGLPGARVLA